MRILVTGATGGLGRNAVEYLLKKGIQVRATGRNKEVGQVLAELGAEFVPLDLTTAYSDEVRALTEGVSDVWHCAALSAPWGAEEDFFACNVEATRKLLDASRYSGATGFVHISTPALYFDYKDRYDIPEEFVPEKYVNLYAKTKAEAETVVQDTADEFKEMKIVTLRPRAIFGPYDQVLLPRLLRVVKSRGGVLPLPRGGRAVLDMTYVDNVVHAMWLATNSSDAVKSGSIYNITNGDPRPVGDVLTTLFTELGRPFSISDTPYILLMGTAKTCEVHATLCGGEPQLTRYSVGALAHHMTLDISRARAKLGYSPIVSMKEGIERTAKWFRENG